MDNLQPLIKLYQDFDYTIQQIKAAQRGVIKDFVEQTTTLWIDFWKSKLQNGESIEIEFNAYRPYNNDFTINAPADLIDEFYVSLLQSNGYSVLTITKVDDKLKFNITSTVDIKF